MRLFIAINFSDEVKDQLCEAIDELRQASAKGNFSKRDNLHLTLVFLGEVRPNDVMDIAACLDRINSESFDLTIAGLGRFGRPGGDISWAGVKLDDNLKKLQRQVSEELALAGFVFDRRDYHPHITLGREVVLKESAVAKYSGAGAAIVKGSGRERDAAGSNPVGAWYAAPENQSLVPEITMNVEKISLMQSERIGGRMVYTEIYARELG